MSVAPRSLSHPSLRAHESRVNPTVADGRAPEPDPSAAVVSGVAVTWRLTRRSLGERAPAGTARLLSLTVRVEGLESSRPSASIFASDPVSLDSVVLEVAALSGAEVIADIRSQVHVECPGVLHATIAGGGDAWRLVYARTPVLAELGVPGGRAEPVGVSVRTV